jgi:Tfp pilus assembly protein PilF
LRFLPTTWETLGTGPLARLTRAREAGYRPVYPIPQKTEPGPRTVEYSPVSVKTPIRTTLLGAVALPLVLALAAACGGGGGGAKPADPTPDALARGIAAHNAGKIDEAKKAYFEVLMGDPKNKFAYYNLGQIARTAGQLAIAEGYYRSALETDPNYGPALFGLGAVRQAFNAVQEAIDLYRKDIAVEPNNAAAHYNLGILLRIQGKTAEGDAEIARAIQLDPKLPQPATPAPSPKTATPTPTR